MNEEAVFILVFLAGVAAVGLAIWCSF